MLKLRQVGFSLAIFGIVLAVQGCWEDQEPQLALLGNGGCRMADGSGGQYSSVTEASLDACKARCFGENGPCTAVEFNRSNSQCEIHSQPITNFERVEGVTCHVLR
jgi:PAN domain